MKASLAPGHGPSRFTPPTLGSALGFALGLALAASTARADEPARARTDFESDRPATRVVLAGANRDTLGYDWHDALPVAVEELEKDEWTIQRTDTAGGRIVTHWKPLKHVLARLVLGRVMARIVVDLVPLPDGRTQVTLRGGLASAEDLEGNPAYGAAVAVYQHSAERWMGRVKQNLDARARQGQVARVEPRLDRGSSHLQN